MTKVFSSGSCRLLTTIYDGKNKIIPIHSMVNNYYGINFMGKFHNAKQHIQFLEWINDEIELPQYILNLFFTSYANCKGVDDPDTIPLKKQSLVYNFEECDFFVFEICSIKIYEFNKYQIQSELTGQPVYYYIQTEKDLYDDLTILYEKIPKNKKIIFQCHFRHNIINDDETKTITNRNIIYDTIKKFCEEHNNVYLHDPSILIKNCPAMLRGDDDIDHFTTEGYVKNFEHLCETYFLK